MKLGKHIIEVGDKIGDVVIKKLFVVQPKSRKKVVYLCKCGNKKETHVQQLFRKTWTGTCGCGIGTHRMSNTRIYAIYRHMKSRCDNQNDVAYGVYGGRGISYCTKWKSFKGFYEDMGSSYKNELTIERIDVNGNYNKENCRWATLHEQSRNRRTNRRITAFGMTKVLVEWSELTGLTWRTIQHRLNYNWNVEKALTTDPIIHGKCKVKKEFLSFVGIKNE